MSHSSLTYLKHVKSEETDSTFEITRPLSIEAGAGCGKTFALIDRIVQLLSSGQTTIDRLLIITFTNNATDELRERIHRRLEELLKKNKTESWIINSLNNIDKAAIYTIHSFAHIVCQQFCNELGSTNSITLLDEDNYASRINEYITVLYRKWNSDPMYKDMMSVLYDNNINLSTLILLFRRILSITPHSPSSQHIDTKSHIHFSLPKQQLESIRYQAIDIIQRISNVNISLLKPTIAERIHAFRTLCEAFRNAQTPNEIFHIITTSHRHIGKKSFSRTVPHSASQSYSHAEEEINELGNLIDNIRSYIHDTLIKYISETLENEAHTYRSHSFAAGLLGFDDIIIGAHYLMTVENIREEIWCQYDCLFIDEFQDTDPYQLSIIQSLISDQSQDDIARICIAGDPLQSIYSFRGADLSNYDRFLNNIDFQHQVLTSSRRSVQTINEYNNKISLELFPNYRQLSSIRKQLSNSTNIFSTSILLDSSSHNIYEEQASYITSHLAQLYNTAVIYDHEQNQERICTYKDMTILIRDRSCLNTIYSSLHRHNIPYKIESSSQVWDHIFIRSICALIAAICLPEDSISVVGALTTPIFHTSKEELALYANSQYQFDVSRNQLWDYRIMDDHPDERDLERQRFINKSCPNISRAFKILTHANMHSIYYSPSDLIRFIFIELLFANPFLDLFGQSEINPLIDLLLANAHSYESSHPIGSPSDYANHLLHCRTSKTGVTPIDNNEDSIRIMTIHAAKGLEFPIVAFIPSHARIAERGLGVFRDNTNDLQIAFTKRLRSSHYSDSHDITNEQIEEEKRLIHVALTRARDYLVVAAHHKSGISTNQAKLLAEAIERSSSTENDVSLLSN